MNATVQPDLTSHVISDDGTKECFLPNYNPETLQPFESEESVLEFIRTKVLLNDNYFIPFKSPEDREAERLTSLAAANVARAKAALLDTDWCENASVRNTDNIPHLMNGDAFDAYRLLLRAIVINDGDGAEIWPVKPKAFWSL